MRQRSARRALHSHPAARVARVLRTALGVNGDKVMSIELCVSDSVKLLIERARAARASVAPGLAYEAGVSFGLYECISLLHQQAQAFGIPPESLGFPPQFDPDNELL